MFWRVGHGDSLRMHAEADRSLEFEVNLVYIVSSRTAKALSQKRKKGFGKKRILNH